MFSLLVVMFSLLKTKHKPKKAQPLSTAFSFYRLGDDAISVRKFISVEEQHICVSGLFISVENMTTGSNIIFLICQLVT